MDPKNLLGSMDQNSLVGKMLNGMATKNFAAGLLTGGVASALLGNKGGKKMLEGAAKVGGLALLGTLAYKAYGNYQQQKASGATPNAMGAVKQSANELATQAKGLFAGLGGAAPEAAPAQTALSVPAIDANPELPVAIIRAMIGAAKADGHVDADETQRIMGHLENAGATPQEKLALMQEMANPQNVHAIAPAAKTPEEAAEIYLAALLVSDSHCAAEQKYLADLAGALKLEPAFTQSLQQELLQLSAQNAA